MAHTSFAVRRSNPRFSFFAEAEVTMRDGLSVPAQVSELSSGGCYLDMLEPIPVGTELSVRISNGLQVCELPGRVIYIHSGYGMGIFGIGVVFSKLANVQDSPLKGWLRDLARKQSERIPN
jgi:hypothetical protein